MTDNTYKLPNSINGYGYELFNTEPFTIHPHESKILNLKVKFYVPLNHKGELYWINPNKRLMLCAGNYFLPKSDNYTEELEVYLVNMEKETLHFELGEKMFFFSVSPVFFDPR